MKSLVRLTALALFAIAPTLALALSVAEANVVSGTGITTTASCAVGDLVWIVTQQSVSGTPTATGTVQGVYTFDETVPGASFDFLSLFHKVCTTTGTETVNITGVAVGRVGVIHIAGFTGTATVLLPGDGNSASASSTALNSGSFSTSHNSEYAIGATDQGGTSTSGPSFLAWAGNNNLSLFVADPLSTGFISPYATAGTSVALTATMSTSGQWIALAAGFYDASGSGASNASFWLIR